MRSCGKVVDRRSLVLVGCFLYDLGAPGRARLSVRLRDKGIERSTLATHNLQVQYTLH